MSGIASSIVGTCGLCRTKGTRLCYSDLIPKAISRWIRLSMNGDPNPNPVVITQDRALQRNFRVAEYFLCPLCEDRLNKGGESWVLKNAYRGGASFPMRDALASASQVVQLSEAKFFDVSLNENFQLQKLICFFVGIFWKAAAREWTSVDHKTQLDFGPYEEGFRSYLMGAAEFPERAALVINLSGNAKPLICALYPYGGGHIEGTRQYRVALPGMAAWLHIGNLPAELKEMCAVRRNRVALVDDLDQLFVRDGGRLIGRTKPASSLLAHR
ncbi:MAG TPA: hypothetical protein VMH05_18500 [Bryobacteraceae bacterium]|nr:hypothetical protein [Bryobacteraceae bacterium]